MAITFPLSLPATPNFSRFSIAQRVAVARRDSPFTGQQQVVAHQGGWWVMGLTLPLMKQAAAQTWIGFLHSLNGTEGTFLVGDPVRTTPLGVATGSPQVNGASQTGKTLITDGWTGSVTGILKAGDFIQLGTGVTTRLYQNQTDVNSDGGGNATLDIFPRLRESPGNNDVITTSNCKGTFRLGGNVSPIDVDLGDIYSIAFSAIEAF